MSETKLSFKNIELEDNCKVLIVTVSGEINESNVDKIAKEILKRIVILPAGSSMIYDLSGLQFINSKGIGYFFDCFRRIADGKGKIIFLNPNSHIRDIFDIVGLSKIIPILSDLDSAMNLINKN